MKKIYFLFLLLVTQSCVSSKLQERGLITEKAMVVSAHPLASAVGAEVLRRGGNAVDAAVAVQFALAVVYPDAGNIGGGGFMVYRSHSGQTDALDYRETAPAAAHPAMYQDSGGKVVAGLSVKGHLAAGVPGTVDGMVKAHQKYGSLPWRDLVQPAITLASKGFPLTAKEASKLNKNREDFLNYNTREPGFILKKRWRKGDTLQLQELAQTLELIRDKGRAGFYEGATAANLEAEMARGKGIITKADLSNYSSTWRTPLTGAYKSYQVISMPPPSSGGIALLQLLKMTENYPMGEWGWNSIKTVHLMIEAERRVYADRAAHLGDPDFYKVPIQGLLQPQYLVKRMADFNPKRATRSKAISPGTPAPPESPNTTHYSIVDQQGNAVSVTTTLNSSFGSKVFVAGSGFLLNNQMDDFSSKPGVPNIYGLVGGEANAIAPGKRMLSSMTPTILEKDGRLFMVVGSMGGSTIITNVFQTILNVTEHGMPAQGAVNARRFHHQWLPDVVLAERGAFGFRTFVGLWLKSHKVVPAPNPIGRVAAIVVLPDGKLEGGAEPRGDDAAAGF